MFCGIWYDLHNLKNVKNTHGGVFLLVKLQALIANHAECRTTKRISHFLADICLLKFNNRNTRKRCEICSKLTIKTPERRQ